MKYWLMKSEPGVYSIDDLARDGRTAWEGVRNYRARNYMKEMAEGDRVLFYHSSADPAGVAGVARVARVAYPDPTQFDAASHYHDAKADVGSPRWFLVDVAFVEKFPELVTLADIRSESSLTEMVLVNNSRLSVQPVEPAEFEQVRRMAGLGPERD
jgi:predicted RNA-binding protein with PUA-like domain